MSVVHQAHIIRQSSPLKTHHAIICPHCNKEVVHSCANPSPNSTTAPDSHFQRRSSPASEAQDEQSPSTHGSQFMGIQHSRSPIVNTTGNDRHEAQCSKQQLSQVTTNLGQPQTASTSSGPVFSPVEPFIFKTPTLDLSHLTSSPSPSTPHSIPRSSTPLSSLTHRAKPEWSVEYTPKVDEAFEMNLIRTIVNKWGAFRIKFSQDGQLLAVAAYFTQAVTIYNVATGKKTCVLEDLFEREEASSTEDLCFNPNAKYLATCSENIIKIWEVGKKRVRNVFRGHRGCIYALDFSPDGRLLVSGSIDNTIRIWNMRDGSSRMLNDFGSMFSSVRFSPNGRHVAAGKGDGNLLVWELRSGHRGLLKGHNYNVPCVAFTPNGEELISGSEDRILKCWDISESTLARISDGGDLKERSTLVGHKDRIFSISVSPDSQWMASGSDDKTVRIWNMGTGRQQCILRGHKKGVRSVDFSPVGGYLASAGEDGVQIWSYNGRIPNSP